MATAKMKIILPLVVWIWLHFVTTVQSYDRIGHGRREIFFLNLEDGYFGCQVNESTDVLQLFELSKLCDGRPNCYLGSDEKRQELKCTDNCQKEDGSICQNGACLDGQCHCNDGYGGCNCEVPDENECKYRPCDVFAHCTNTLGSFSCTCYPGYQGDGFHCEDINECEDPNIAARCVENAWCCNLPAHFLCKCNPGFQGDGEVQCVDIDECAQPNVCGQNALCRNFPGNYTCECPEGFFGNPYDGCVDVDECDLPGACGPGAYCSNVVGGRQCSCPPGYEGDAYTTGCVDIDECSRSNPCGRDALCSNQEGSFRCSCPPGFIGDPLTGCTDIQCRSHSECSSQQACIGGKCNNPCLVSNPCQKSQDCHVQDHQPVCVKVCQCRKHSDCGRNNYVCDGCNCVLHEEPGKTTGCEHCPPGVACDPTTGACIRDMGTAPTETLTETQTTVTLVTQTPSISVEKNVSTITTTEEYPQTSYITNKTDGTSSESTPMIPSHETTIDMERNTEKTELVFPVTLTTEKFVTVTSISNVSKSEEPGLSTTEFTFPIEPDIRETETTTSELLTSTIIAEVTEKSKISSLGSSTETYSTSSEELTKLPFYTSPERSSSTSGPTELYQFTIPVEPYITESEITTKESSASSVGYSTIVEKSPVTSKHTTMQPSTERRTELFYEYKTIPVIVYTEPEPTTTDKKRITTESPTPTMGKSTTESTLKYQTAATTSSSEHFSTLSTMRASKGKDFTTGESIFTTSETEPRTISSTGERTTETISEISEKTVYTSATIETTSVSEMETQSTIMSSTRQNLSTTEVPEEETTSIGNATVTSERTEYTSAFSETSSLPEIGTPSTIVSYTEERNFENISSAEVSTEKKTTFSRETTETSESVEYTSAPLETTIAGSTEKMSEKSVGTTEFSTDKKMDLAGQTTETSVSAELTFTSLETSSFREMESPSTIISPIGQSTVQSMTTTKEVSKENATIFSEETTATSERAEYTSATLKSSSVSKIETPSTITSFARESTVPSIGTTDISTDKKTIISGETTETSEITQYTNATPETSTVHKIETSSTTVGYTETVFSTLETVTSTEGITETSTGRRTTSNETTTFSVAPVSEATENITLFPSVESSTSKENMTSTEIPPTVSTSSGQELISALSTSQSQTTIISSTPKTFTDESSSESSPMFETTTALGEKTTYSESSESELHTSEEITSTLVGISNTTFMTAETSTGFPEATGFTSVGYTETISDTDRTPKELTTLKASTLSSSGATRVVNATTKASPLITTESLHDTTNAESSTSESVTTEEIITETKSTSERMKVEDFEIDKTTEMPITILENQTKTEESTTHLYTSGVTRQTDITTLATMETTFYNVTESVIYTIPTKPVFETTSQESPFTSIIFTEKFATETTEIPFTNPQKTTEKLATQVEQRTDRTKSPKGITEAGEGTSFVTTLGPFEMTSTTTESFKIININESIPIISIEDYKYLLNNETSSCNNETECSGDEVCVNEKCIGGCSIGHCATNALCKTEDHEVSCVCPSHYVGDATKMCFKGIRII